MSACAELKASFALGLLVRSYVNKLVTRVVKPVGKGNACNDPLQRVYINCGSLFSVYPRTSSVLNGLSCPQNSNANTPAAQTSALE